MLSSRLYRIHFARVLAITAFIAVQVHGLSAGQWTKDLGNGVTLTQQVRPASEGKPQVINVVTVDPASPGVKLRAVLGQDKVLGKSGKYGCERMSSAAQRLNATVAVNADFFPIETDVPGDPLNLQISTGELVSEPSPQRSALGITSDGKVMFDRLDFDARIILPDGKWFPIRGLNRPRKDHEMVAYTPRFFDSTRTGNEGSEIVVSCAELPVKVGVLMKCTVQEARPGAGDTTVPENGLVLSGRGTGSKFIDENLKPGTEFTMRFDLKPATTTGWDKVVEAVGGGPRILRDGKVSLEWKEEGFGSGFNTTSHPRTAAGVTRDGKLVLVTVDGRQSISGGMDLGELARVMLAHGCVDAINLDGGGSTTMAASFGILNSPSGSAERSVANGFAVLTDPAASCVPDVDFTISGPSATVEPGSTRQLVLLDASTGQPLSPEIAQKAIWSATSGFGFVDQSGLFYGTKERKGEVVVRLGSRTHNLPIEVAAPEPEKPEAEPKPETGVTPEQGVQESPAPSPTEH